MDIARAAPSVGSVPAPISSNNIRLLLSAFFRISTVLVICELKVLRLCSILCSSPISANISSNTAISEWSSAGMLSPASAIRVRRPTVFSETVLPPVLGPVIIRRLKSVPRYISIGTTLCGSMRGCLPFFMLMRPSVFITGRLQL